MKASGNTILVTGGAGGIGQALCRLLVQADNAVISADRDPKKQDLARASIPGLATIRADLADPADRAALAAEVRRTWPDLNVLVNMAGVIHTTDLSAPSAVADLETELAVNLVAPVALTALLLPDLCRQPSATVVNVTTGYVFVPTARFGPYSATKTALHVWTQALRFQLRDTTVDVVEVTPPAVATRMVADYHGATRSPDWAARHIYDGLLSGRHEVVFGASRIARIAGRAAPRITFGLLNRSEVRAAERAER